MERKFFDQLTPQERENLALSFGVKVEGLETKIIEEFERFRNNIDFFWTAKQRLLDEFSYHWWQ